MKSEPERRMKKERHGSPRGGVGRRGRSRGWVATPSAVRGTDLALHKGESFNYSRHTGVGRLCVQSLRKLFSLWTFH
jgi:hypothetical protein